jgi:hypothetical protein
MVKKNWAPTPSHRLSRSGPVPDPVDGGGGVFLRPSRRDGTRRIAPGGGLPQTSKEILLVGVQSSS